MQQKLRLARLHCCLGSFKAFPARIRGYNILFRVLTFAKPECDNFLQPEPRSGGGCNTLSHEGLANVNTEKNVISLLLYTFLSSTPGFNGNEAHCYHVLMGMKPAASVWSMVAACDNKAVKFR